MLGTHPSLNPGPIRSPVRKNRSPRPPRHRRIVIRRPQEGRPVLFALPRTLLRPTRDLHRPNHRQFDEPPHPQRSLVPFPRQPRRQPRGKSRPRPAPRHLGPRNQRRLNRETLPQPKTQSADAWEHQSIRLLPDSHDPSYQAIGVTASEAADFRVLGEFMAVVATADSP